MSEPFSVECTSCFVSFKLKDRKLIGKKIRCPKCKEPILVKDAAQVADDWLSDDEETKDAPAPMQRGLPPKVSQSGPQKTKKSDSQKVAKKKKATQGSGIGFDVLMWVIGGLIGGGLGAMGWALIVSNTGREIGWVAWGVGVFAGGGVRLFSRGHEGELPGLTAACVGLCAILLGKYLAIRAIYSDNGIDLDAAEIRIEVEEMPPVHENEMIAALADEIAFGREEKGIAIEWPAEDEDYEHSEDPEELFRDYPIDIWQEATVQWNAKPQAERDAIIADTQKLRDSITDLAVKLDSQVRDFRWWKEAFGIFDLIWLPLAVGTAYKIGGGFEGDD